MKKRTIFTLAFYGLLVTSVLTACSTKKSIGLESMKPQVERTAQSPAQYGFMQVANDSNERLWFVTNTIDKDSQISGLYIIKNGKATYYYLGSSTVVETDSSTYLETDATLTLSDIEKLSNKDIIQKAQKLDRENYFAQAQYLSDWVEDYLNKGTWLQKAEKGEDRKSADSFYQYGLEDVNLVKDQIAEFNSEDGYKEYRKGTSDVPLTAVVETDSSGNTVISEKIDLPIFNNLKVEYEEGLHIYGIQESNGSLQSLIKGTESLTLDAGSFGSVYDSDYLGFDFLITRDFSDGIITFDLPNTKNVTEE